MDPIEIMANADGSFDLPAIHVSPYVAPVTVDPPPVETQPPAVVPVAKFVATQVDSRVAVWDKSTGFPAGTKGTLDWGDASTPGAIVAAQSGSVGHTYANGTYTITEKYTVEGVDYAYSLTVTVPKVAPTSDPTPPSSSDPTPVSSPPTTAAATADVPSVIADGQSILYHYPMDETLAAAVDHIEIPGTFGGSPTVVAKIAWNFGDGTNGFGADGRHPYDKPGTYTITGSVNYKDGRIVPFGPLTVQVGSNV